MVLPAPDMDYHKAAGKSDGEEDGNLFVRKVRAGAHK